MLAASTLFYKRSPTSCVEGDSSHCHHHPGHILHHLSSVLLVIGVTLSAVCPIFLQCPGTSLLDEYPWPTCAALCCLRLAEILCGQSREEEQSLISIDVVLGGGSHLGRQPVVMDAT